MQWDHESWRDQLVLTATWDKMKQMLEIIKVLSIMSQIDVLPLLSLISLEGGMLLIREIVLEWGKSRLGFI